MPLYEYQCQECGEQFEELRSHKSADDEIMCLNCHSTSTTRILSTFNAKTSNGSLSSSSSGCTNCAGGNCASCH